MKQIRLENFRCFRELDVALRPGINLFIGDNASGKTSLLRACRYVLSAFFLGFSDENTHCSAPGDEDFTVMTEHNTILPEQPLRIFFTPDHSDSTSVIRKNSKKNSRTLLEGLRLYRDYARTLLTSQEALPLFASFSTEDIHSSRKINAAKFNAYTQKASFGYYECLDGDGFLRYWLKRLLVLQEGQKGLCELEVVRRAVTMALGTEGCGIITDMHVRPMQGKVYYLFTDGREVEAGLLSDGYRRLVNIVTDVAFRCALLNGRLYGSEAALQTTGTVLIDEVDMHLHPSLQATVLRGLRHAFPKLQFIVTTHAPMVMSNIGNQEEDVVYQLDYSEGVYSLHPRCTYGLDASTITQLVLNQTPRSKEVDDELRQIYELVDKEQNVKARGRLEDMKKRFGDNLPELAEIEAMLNFTVSDDVEI